MAGRLPDHLARGLGQDFDPNRHQPKLASGGATCLQGRRQGAVVEVVELAPDRQAVGKARDLHAAGGPLATGRQATSQAIGTVVGRGLRIGRASGREKGWQSCYTPGVGASLKKK